MQMEKLYDSFVKAKQLSRANLEIGIYNLIANLHYLVQMGPVQQAQQPPPLGLYSLLLELQPLPRPPPPLVKPLHQ